MRGKANQLFPPKFLFNTYYHVRRRQRAVMADWVEAVETVILASGATSAWLLNYLATDGLR